MLKKFLLILSVLIALTFCAFTVGCKNEDNTPEPPAQEQPAGDKEESPSDEPSDEPSDDPSSDPSDKPSDEPSEDVGVNNNDPTLGDSDCPIIPWQK